MLVDVNKGLVNLDHVATVYGDGTEAARGEELAHPQSLPALTALAKSISRAPDATGHISAASVIGAALDLLAKYEVGQHA